MTSDKPDSATSRSRADLYAARMRAVATVASGVLRCHTYAELDRVIMVAAAEILPYDAFTFAVYLPDRHALRFLSGGDGDAFEQGAVIPVAGTPSETVIRERRALLTLRAESGVAPGVRVFGTGRRSESIIRVPVCTEDTVLGVLSVQSYTPDAYTADDVEVMQAFAAVAASTMQNIDLLAEQRRMQAALRESETRFRTVVESMSEGILITDLEDRIVYTNQRNCDITGYTAEQLLGQAALTLLVAPEYQAVAWNHHRLREGGTSSRYTVQEVRGDGSRIWVEVAGSPLQDATGRVTGTIAVVSDVTARKQAEDALRSHAAALAESEQRFRHLVQNLREAFWLYDCDSGQVIYVSPGYERIWGRPAESFYRERELWLRDVHPEDVAMVRAALALQERGDYDIEYRILSPDGAVKWVRDRAFPVHDAAGAVVRIAGFAEDVTAERQREAQLRRAERLAAVGTLVGGVAHELNNPLQAIRGFTDLLLEGGVAGEDREALETIAREARRAAGIVAELRLLARRSQEEPRTHGAVDLNDVVRHVLRTREYSLTAANIEVRPDLAHELPRVLGDASQLEQVILNLVVNASQALARVEAGRLLVVRTRRTPSGAAVYVHDNGPGIEAGHLPRLFDPFWTTKSPGEGTGLGLTVVHRIVTEHGGTVHVDTEPGRGTTFMVELPAAVDMPDGTADPRSDGGGESGATEARKLRLLVVDDEDALRQMMGRFARRRGHDVDVACEGGEALALIAAAEAERRPYDVVFSDLHMPGMSGRQLAETLLERDRTFERRLFLLTGAVESSDIAWLQERTGVAILHKPFSLDDVRRVLAPFEAAGA